MLLAPTAPVASIPVPSPLSRNRARQTAMGAVAEDLGLLPSGGTDYHGDGETYAEAIAETWVPPQIATGVMAVLGAGIAP